METICPWTQASWLMRTFLRVTLPPSMPRECDQNTSGPFAHRSDSERRLELAFTFQIAHSSDSNCQETAGPLEGDFGFCVKSLMHPLEPCIRICCRTWMKHIRSIWCVLFHWKCNAFNWENKKYTQKQSFSSHFLSDSNFLKDGQHPHTFLSHKLFWQLLTR